MKFGESGGARGPTLGRAGRPAVNRAEPGYNAFREDW